MDQTIGRFPVAPGLHSIALLRALLLSSSTIGLLAGSAALADPATDRSSASGSLETITVTATKRSEDLKDVPLSISAVTGAELEERHIENYQDLVHQVPGIYFASGGSAGLNSVGLRGISSTAGSPTVGMYLDEVPITFPNIYSSGATQPLFFDMDRIEVLRGPQGTLYGASSMGGTIRFITRQPDLDQFGGSVYSELSGTEHGGINYEERAVVNVPLVPGQAALRLGADYQDESGYINRLTPDGNIANEGTNQEQTGAIKATLKVKLDDNWTITPSVFAQRLRVDDNSLYYVGLPKLSQDELIMASGKDEMFIPSVTVDGDLGWADLTSATSYFWRRLPHVFDSTGYNAGYFSYILETTPALQQRFPNANPGSIGNIASPAYNTPESSQYSEELRLASKSTKESGLPFTWLAGIYAADQHLNMSDQEFIPGLSKALQQVYGVPASTIGNLIGYPQLSDSADSEDQRTDLRQISGFGEITYYVTDALSATAGLRYLVARATDGGNKSGYFAGGNTEYAAPTTHDYALTPKFALSYAIDPDVTAYASATKGYRLGAAEHPIPASICAGDLSAIGLGAPPQSYTPDKLWSYETGAKSSLLDNRLSVNGDFYYIDWSNVQQSIYLPTCGYQITVNAGTAQSYGSELEIRFKATSDLDLSLSGGYTHATLTQAAPGTGAVDGDKLLYTPDWTMTIGVDYHHALTDSADGFIRADWDWTGASHGAYLASNTDYSRPVYDVLNGAIGVDIGEMEISLFAKNLLNQQKTLQQPSLFSVTEGYTVRPLTVGVAFSTNF